MSKSNPLDEGLPPQLELFSVVGTSSRGIMPKDDIHSMEHPLFAMSDGDTSVVVYEHAEHRIEITPSVKGRATQKDKDVILFCMSRLVDAINDKQPVSRVVRCKAGDVLTFARRTKSGEGYRLLENSLDRLAGTRVKTTIPTGKARRKQVDAFGIIDTWKAIRRDSDGTMEELEIKLSEWTYSAVLALDVLSISPEYFSISKSIERRLYELARKHCGRQPHWKIKLENLQKKVGTTRAMRNFRVDIKSIVKANKMPDYKLEYLAREDAVAFSPRKGAVLDNVIPRAESQ